MTDGEHRPTVLVVDDHRFSRTVLTRILSAAGYRIETAENGAEALASLQSSDPDAFILDAEMPGLDTARLAPRIRDTARILLRFYIGLTICVMLALMACGVTGFDALWRPCPSCACGCAKIPASTSPPS